MFNNLFGKINWFNIGIVSGIASAFSWFVLNNTNASVFFMIGAAVLFAIAFVTNQNEEKITDIHRSLDECRNSQHELVDRAETRLDGRIDSIWTDIISIRESIDNLSSKRK